MQSIEMSRQLDCSLWFCEHCSKQVGLQAEREAMGACDGVDVLRLVKGVGQTAIAVYPRWFRPFFGAGQE
jgi:hypothetical protein